MTKEQYNELFALMEELDLVPLSIFPKEVRPLVLDYLNSLEQGRPFEELNELETRVTSEYLRKRRKTKIQITSDDLTFFDNICVSNL